MHRTHVWQAIAVLAAAGGACPTATAAPAPETYIRLDGIPDRLVFPVPEGTNVVVTATVHGAQSSSAWLATGESSRLRVVMAAVGPNQFQVNLADEDVAAVLRASAGTKQFRIFAQTSTGAVVASIPIRFSSALQPVTYLECWVSADEGGASRRELSRWGTSWVDPGRVRRLAASFRGDGAAPVVAVVKDHSWSFAPAGDDGTLALVFTDEIRAAFSQCGHMSVEFDSGGARRHACELRARPASLALTGGIASVTVLQRSSKAVPGSNEYLFLHIADITAGQVMLTIRTADGLTLVDTESMCEGSAVGFRLDAAAYVVTARKIVNLLFGDDWATFDITAVKPDAAAAIESLLTALAAADVTFVRNGTAHTAAEAADHLRKKYVASGTTVASVAQFIDEYASVSSETGTAYLVRLPDGTTRPAAAWLKELAAK